MDEEALQSLIQVQEKLHATMGRGRSKGAIGVHDLVALKGREARSSTDSQAATPRDDGDGPRDDAGTGGEKTIRYTSMAPDGEEFVPLESDEAMTPREVTERHHMGAQYADLVADMERYPAIHDDIGLFSFPPVINGRRTEVSGDSRDLLIEMTGTDQWTIDRMCNIVCYALEARGARVERVNVAYAEDTPGEYAGRTLDRPDLGTSTKTVSHDRIERIVGIDFDREGVVDCAERAGLDADPVERDGDRAYEVEIPPYRVDVWHPLDVIDDIGRAYGFNDLDPQYPDVSTVGGRHERSRLEDAARDALVGLGFEDLLNFHMINEEENFERLGIDPGDDVVGGGEPATIRQPYSEAYTILRTWALPSLLMVLENNTHRAYPQHLAEIGLAAERDDEENTGVAERRTVSAVLAGAEVSYEDARARLQALAGAFGKELATPPTEHPTFIPGRTAAVALDGEHAGVIGEVHPEVIVEHDLEVPVAAVELRLDALR